jgi:polyphosphate glucokinase
MNVLAIDIGGTWIKLLVSGQTEPQRVESSPTLTPQRMVDDVKNAAADWKYDVVSIGYPGPVVNGRPLTDPWNLGQGWVGFDFDKAFGRPVRVINDAAMQALGTYRGRKMLFLGLGTGLGSCMIVDGIVEPMELGHLPYRDATFEDYVGIRGLRRLGMEKWREHVADVVTRLTAALEPEEVVLGGGNVHNLEKLPPGCRAGDNSDAFAGAFRLWEQPEKASPDTAKASTKTRNSFLPALAALLSLGAAVGQSAADPPTASTALTEPPVSVRPFQLELPSDHLFGDWGGVLTRLDSAGIKPTLTLVTDFAWNPTGGRNQGSTEASNLGLDLLVDLDTIAGIKGGSFLAQISERWGSSLTNDYIGNVFNVQQVFGGQTFRMVDMAYQQKLLDDHVEFRIGRIAAGDDFLVSPYNYLFVQNGFDGNPVGIFFNAPGMTAYPNATWGTMVKYKPTDRCYVMAGVYNGDTSIRNNNRHGADLSLDGPVFVLGEVGYQVNGLPGEGPLLGNYKAGFWYDNAEFNDFQSGETKRGSWGFYGLFDQVLISWGDPSENRGFGVFGSFMVAVDPSVQQMPYFFTAGVAARGIFDALPKDSCGLGIVYGHFSHDLRDAQQQAQMMDPAVGVQDYEMAIELTYRFNFAGRAVFVQPDLQYIIRPGGTGKYDDAVVLGVQVGINF